MSARQAEQRAEQAACGGCGAPLGRGEQSSTLCRDVCIDGRDGMRDLLSKLTARVIGAEAPGRTPLRMVIPAPNSGPRDQRQPGYGRSTAWDTPRGEAANLPRMLREATARQTRFAADQGVRVRGGEESGLSVDHHAGDRLTDLRDAVAALAVATARATGTGPTRGTWGVIARWLDGQMGAIARLDGAPDLLARLQRVVAAGERHVDRPPARLYLGPCDHAVRDVATGVELAPTTRCGGEYLATEGDTVAACTGCGATVGVEARKRDLLEQAADRWMTARQIEQLTVVLGFPRVPDSTIESWGNPKRSGAIQRHRIPVLADDGTVAGEPWHFLLRDVLGRLEVQRQRQQGRRAG